MRKHYLDNIRGMTVMLVLLFHVIYMFNGEGIIGVIGPITEHRLQDVLQYMLYPWFMDILFIVSGISAKLYLDRHSEKEFLRARTRKLLVPSTLGLFAFQWIQGYFNMRIGGGYADVRALPCVLRYCIMAVSGTGVLWTIQMLWLFSLLLLLLRRWKKESRLCEKANMAVLLLLAIPAWGMAQILNTPIVVCYHFGLYGFCYFAGYYLFSWDSVIEKLQRYSPYLIGGSAVLCCVYIKCYFGENFAEAPVFNSPLGIVFAWSTCLAVLGGMKRYCDKETRFTRFINQRAWGIYVFHYLPLSATALLLTEHTTLPAICIYLLTALAAFCGALALYAIISRIPLLRWCVLGIKKEKHHVC